MSKEVITKGKIPNIVSKSAKMQKVYELVNRVIPVKVNIHIRGEDGCGKDIMAEYIHHNSKSSGKFIVIDSIEYNDIIKDTGYSSIYNIFKEAKNGTVYISNIASACQKLQECLLLAINNIEQDYSEYAPRIISSTNRNLEDLSKNNRFDRRLVDCFITVITIPPLRERREDIEDLIKILLKENNKTDNNLKLSIAAYDAILSYDWPGNIRQLANALYHGIVNTSNGEILLSSLPREVRRKHGMASAKATTIDELYKFAKGIIDAGFQNEQIDTYFEYIKAVEIPLIEAAMDRAKGNKSTAAKLMKINRNTLYKKLKDYNIE